tara:strand:+ start:11365 stop:12171 length:807 start_codon:yes stop_codon:yes gene_type:complete
VSWQKIIKQDSLIISEILDKALPNFYDKLIQVHPDMKETLDGLAEEFRTEYYKLKISTPTEEEIITEIVMVCIEIINDFELEFKYADVPPPSLKDLLKVVDDGVVRHLIRKARTKFIIDEKLNKFFKSDIMFNITKLLLLGCLFVVNYELQSSVRKSWEEVLKRNKGGRGRTRKKGKARKKRKKKKRKKSGDNFKREKDEGLHGWFSRRGGKQKKGGKTQRGWIDCSSCGKKGGTRPCGREDASKGRKRRCRPTCAACKTYKRRKGTP